MPIIAQQTIVRTDNNTIDLDTDYNDLNLKASTLADDVVAFVEAAIGDVEASVTFDREATAADRVQTGNDVIITTANREQTALDAIATSEDVATIDATVLALATDLLRTQTILVEHTAFQ